MTKEKTSWENVPISKTDKGLVSLIYKGFLYINVEMDLANTWLRKCAKKMKRQFTEEKINSVRESSRMWISQTLRYSSDKKKKCLSFKFLSNTHWLGNWASKLTFLYFSSLISEKVVTVVTHKIALNINWVLLYVNCLERLGGYSNCENFRNGFPFLFSIYVIVRYL